MWTAVSRWFVDARSGERYLDFFSMYASMAVGYNHPQLVAIEPQLGRLAVNKPSNSGMFIPPPWPSSWRPSPAWRFPTICPMPFHRRRRAGGGERLKTAFDWKVRKHRERPAAAGLAAR
ncbi:MAG: hypothetical protein R2864_08195 [Syntrophotaleaceae bacterium]